LEKRCPLLHFIDFHASGQAEKYRLQAKDEVSIIGFNSLHYVSHDP
jgi:hypothetical protein